MKRKSNAYWEKELSALVFDILAQREKNICDDDNIAFSKKFANVYARLMVAALGSPDEPPKRPQ